MKIDKESLSKILDKQYDHCKAHIILEMQDKIQKLEDYRGGDVIDIRTEIIIGHSMEETLFHEWYSDYYNKSAVLKGGGDNKKNE